MSTKVLKREFEMLKSRIVEIGQFADMQLRNAMEALLEGDNQKSQNVIDGDEELDRLEVEFEEDCLKLLALYHLFSTDLRFVIALLKMNNDLERIGDLAVDIARRAKQLTQIGRSMDLPPEIAEMTQKAKLMVRKSLLALVETDTEIAQMVLDADVQLDILNNTVYETVVERLKKHPESAEEQVLVLTVARRLERIGDHATNVAEDVIYLNTGDIVRHGKEEQ
jgi:phosphate transport system protein